MIYIWFCSFIRHTIYIYDSKISKKISFPDFVPSRPFCCSIYRTIGLMHTSSIHICIQLHSNSISNTPKHTQKTHNVKKCYASKFINAVPLCTTKVQTERRSFECYLVTYICTLLYSVQCTYYRCLYSLFKCIYIKQFT